VTELRPLTEADFEVLSSLARTIWRAHYSAIISLAQIDHMLAGRLTAENLSRYVNSSERWLELLLLDSRAVGYCSYALQPDDETLKLEQIYLLPELHGRGLGGVMMRHAVSRARALGRTRLVLTVNKRNTGSIGVYRHHGFAITEDVVTEVGNGFVMDDYIMEKRL